MDNLNNGQNQYSPDIKSFQYSQANQFEQYNTYDNNASFEGVSSSLTEGNAGISYSNKPVKGKSSKKGIIIGTIAFVLAIIAVAVVYVVAWFNESFKVNDFDKVNSACEKVFGKSLEVEEYNEPYKYAGTEYAVKREGTIRSYVDNSVFVITWIEFVDEATATKYMTDYENYLDEEHDRIQEDLGDSSMISGRNKIEWSYESKNNEGKGGRMFVAKTDNCVLNVTLAGDIDDIKKMQKSLKRKIK